MKISVKGYKSIAEERSIELNGLTILAGANSSGKSAFMQPLLLIKQTLENDFDAGSLMLDGPNVKLSDTKDIISKIYNIEKVKSRKSILGISVLFNDYEKSTKRKTNEIKVTYGLKNEGVIVDSISKGSDGSNKKLTLREGMTQENILRTLPKDDVEFFTKVVSKSKKESLLCSVIRKKCFLEVEIKTERGSFGFGMAPAKELGVLATNLIHVPGLRGNPERSYRLAVADAKFPGVFDIYVASIINKWKKNNDDKLIKINSNLERLGLTFSVDVNKLNQTRIEVLVSRFKSSAKKDDLVNIADVGFGVSQVLPVLVALLEAKENSIVYIEQPELHLHPKAQSILAGIIAESINENKAKIVIETHSAILIRSLQTLVVKSELPKETISLNWFTLDEETGQTNISEAKLDDFGRFGDWPADFDEVLMDVEGAYLDAVENKAFGE